MDDQIYLLVTNVLIKLGFSLFVWNSPFLLCQSCRSLRNESLGGCILGLTKRS